MVKSQFILLLFEWVESHPGSNEKSRNKKTYRHWWGRKSVCCRRCTNSGYPRFSDRDQTGSLGSTGLPEYIEGRTGFGLDILLSGYRDASGYFWYTQGNI